MKIFEVDSFDIHKDKKLGVYRSESGYITIKFGDNDFDFNHIDPVAWDLIKEVLGYKEPEPREKWIVCYTDVAAEEVYGYKPDTRHIANVKEVIHVREVLEGDDD